MVSNFLSLNRQISNQNSLQITLWTGAKKLANFWMLHTSITTEEIKYVHPRKVEEILERITLAKFKSNDYACLFGNFEYSYEKSSDNQEMSLRIIT